MLVHAVIEIDDEEFDCIDQRLPAKISYLSKPGHLPAPQHREAEGYITPYILVDKEDVEMLAVQLEEEDVVIFRYPSSTDPSDATLIKDILKSEFPNNKVLGLTQDIDLLIENASDAVDMLEKMIAHIKVMEGNQKKIILT